MLNLTHVTNICININPKDLLIINLTINEAIFFKRKRKIFNKLNIQNIFIQVIKFLPAYNYRIKRLDSFFVLNLPFTDSVRPIIS